MKINVTEQEKLLIIEALDAQIAKIADDLQGLKLALDETMLWMSNSDETSDDYKDFKREVEQISEEIKHEQKRIDERNTLIDKMINALPESNERRDGDITYGKSRTKNN